MSVELQWNEAGTVARDPGSAGSHQVVSDWMDGTVDVEVRNHAGVGPRVDQELHPAQLVGEPKEACRSSIRGSWRVPRVEQGWSRRQSRELGS